MTAQHILHHRVICSRRSFCRQKHSDILCPQSLMTEKEAPPTPKRSLTIPRDFGNECKPIFALLAFWFQYLLFFVLLFLCCVTVWILVLTEYFITPPPLSSCAVQLFVVRTMMYGFGDEPNPRTDSVALMEEFVIDYIVGLASKVSCFQVFSSFVSFLEREIRRRCVHCYSHGFLSSNKCM